MAMRGGRNGDKHRLTDAWEGMAVIVSPLAI